MSTVILFSPERGEFVALSFIVTSIFILFYAIKKYRHGGSWADVRGYILPFFAFFAWALDWIYRNHSDILFLYHVKYIVDSVLVALCLYFVYISAGNFKKTKRWGAVRKDVHMILFAMMYILISTPLAPAETSPEWMFWIWLVLAFALTLTAFWNAVWITFTKEDFNAFTPYVTYLILGIYVCILIFAFKKHPLLSNI